MFALIHVGERAGSGLCDVYHVWEENGLERPQIVETVDPDRITLTLQTESDGNPHVNDGNVDGNDGNLTVNENLVLQILINHPELSAVKIAGEIGLSKPTVERVLRSLKGKGVISREGSTRGKWIILK